jgi:hypothetical protein
MFAEAKRVHFLVDPALVRVNFKRGSRLSTAMLTATFFGSIP